MIDIYDYLKQRPYPGRGILLGADPEGRPVAAYFIMGRSENSRNRVFTPTADGIRTEAHDPSLMTDPSLIIYHPVRRTEAGLIVTNGDQTDTLRDYLAEDKSFFEALYSREFEPDEPNYTPRISGLLAPDGSFTLSILKSAEGRPDFCERFFFGYGKIPGEGRFISTYEGYGDPIPSFGGEPVHLHIPEGTAETLARSLWDSLDSENRVSIYTNVGGDSFIINKRGDKI